MEIYFVCVLCKICNPIGYILTQRRSEKMNMNFDYPYKTRDDFLMDVVKQLIERRSELGITQDELNHMLGVADRLVSKWECGVRTPTSFHLYCWADALKGQFVFVPNELDANKLIIQLQSQLANDNSVEYERSANDNECLIPERQLGIIG